MFLFFCGDGFSNCCCLPGGVVYDGVQIKIPDAPLQDFHSFLSAENALQATSNLQNAAESGPARHKISTVHATFGSCAKTRDWTTADERSLASTFWMGTEFTLHTDEFLETLPEEMSKLDTSKLFCQRYSAVKPLFQCVGDLACPAAGLGVLFVVALPILSYGRLPPCVNRVKPAQSEEFLLTCCRR